MKIIEWLYNLPLWIKIILLLYIESASLSSGLKNILDPHNRDYFYGALCIFIFLTVFVVFINNLISMGLKIF